MKKLIKLPRIDKIHFSERNLRYSAWGLLLSILWITAVFGMLIERETASISPDIVKISEPDPRLKEDISRLTEGYPIERMAGILARKDRDVAAFMVAIAKKESNWGKRKPVLNGQDCYNYWGYRGKSEKMGSSGHTCFDSPRQAISVVSKRIDELINTYGRDTARKMIVWKCGYSCAGHSDESVRKWISDVDFYLRKVSE